MSERSTIDEQLQILKTRNATLGINLPSFLRSSNSEIAYLRCDEDPYVAFARVNPGQVIKNQFGINLEVPVVVSLHDPLQPRVFDLFEKASEHSSSEIDIGILVARDKRAKLFARDKARIGIPILVILESELPDALRNSSLREKFAELLRSINYFDIKGEVRRKEQFFGRKDDIDKVLESILADQSIGIFGLRKSGKTSLILQVQDRLTSMGENVAFITLNEASSDVELRQIILERVRDSVGRRNGAGFPKLRLINKSGQRNASLTPEAIKASWASDLRRLLAYSGRRQTIILDEVDLANVEDGETRGVTYEERKSCHRVLRELRGIIQAQHDSQPHVPLVLLAAGVASSIVTRVNRFGEENQLFQFFTVRPLQPLAAAEVREMVRTLGRRSGLSFKEPLFDFLLNEYGGHPQLTRQACSLVAEARTRRGETSVPYRVTLADLESAASDPSETAPHFGTIQNLEGFGLWYPAEYQEIQTFLRGDADHIHPSRITHAIDFGIFDRAGRLRMNALRRES